MDERSKTTLRSLANFVATARPIWALTLIALLPVFVVLDAMASARNESDRFIIWFPKGILYLIGYIVVLPFMAVSLFKDWLRRVNR
jgi:integral membrane sensor domain MASE1